MMVRVRFRVDGRVQGVGFRVWAAREARGLALQGWVSNQHDGSVELEVAGAAAAVSAFRARLADGPRFARVDSVLELQPTTRTLRADFEIVH